MVHVVYYNIYLATHALLILHIFIQLLTEHIKLHLLYTLW